MLVSKVDYEGLYEWLAELRLDLLPNFASEVAYQGKNVHLEVLEELILTIYQVG